jgi:hypothetical protein
MHVSEGTTFGEIVVVVVGGMVVVVVVVVVVGGMVVVVVVVVVRMVVVVVGGPKAYAGRDPRLNTDPTKSVVTPKRLTTCLIRDHNTWLI